MKQSLGDTIKVFVRVRPFNEKQRSTESCVITDVSTSTIQMRDKEADHRFSFDQIFQGQSTQEEVYAKVGHQVVQSAFQGFNGTVFAYGQTSSGKTHTCIGPDYTDKQKRGILPRMVGHIYDKIKQQPSYIEFRIKISMVQIYMQKIKDLLDPTKSDLKIRQKAGKGIYIQDVTQQYVASEQQTIAIIKKGIVNRSVGQTNMNDTSSRSHMAFIITLYQNNLKDASAKSGRIILVDLAGSQKISKTGAQGKLLDQAKQINKSLLALGNVINSLTENKVAHIPYRDSKLTRLLQESLGGNSKTNLIINVSPSQLNEPQTLSSLRFGNRAKQIKNKPKVNRQYTVAELLLLLQKAETRIKQLEQIITQMSMKKTKTMKKPSQVYVQNLLDSDHPILQTDQGEPNEQNQQILQKSKKQKLSSSAQRKSSRVKLAFQSQCVQSSDQEQQNVSILKRSKQIYQTQTEAPIVPTTPSNTSIVNNTAFAQIQQLSKKLAEQKQILAEQIQMLNVQKIELSRELDILQQKYEFTVKQTKNNSSKNLYLQRQNQKLLQKLVSQTCLLQQSQLKCQQLQQKVSLYEQRILNIAALQQKEQQDNSMQKVFGTSSPQAQFAAETKKIADFVRSNKRKNSQGVIDLQEKIKEKMIVNQNKDARIKELQQKNKILQEQISLFKHLQKAKQAFIEQKLKFSGQKQRIYKDLQNRIQKVLQLEQKLDQQVERRKYYQQLIKNEQSQKNRKILLLQQHLNEVSQNYYVLKGQQSSWSKDTHRIQSKLETKNKRILALQKQIISLKEHIQSLKLHVEELEDNPRENSVLDLDLSMHMDQRPVLDDGYGGYGNEGGGYGRSNIVKVVKSSNLKQSK